MADKFTFTLLSTDSPRSVTPEDAVVLMTACNSRWQDRLFISSVGATSALASQLPMWKHASHRCLSLEQLPKFVSHVLGRCISHRCFYRRK